MAICPCGRTTSVCGRTPTRCVGPFYGRQRPADTTPCVRGPARQRDAHWPAGSVRKDLFANTEAARYTFSCWPFRAHRRRLFASVVGCPLFLTFAVFARHRDEQLRGKLLAMLQECFQDFGGAAWLMQHRDLGDMLSQVLYYGLAKLQTWQTLGEEYCELYAVDMQTGKSPSKRKRAALVLSQTLGPALGLKLLAALKQSSCVSYADQLHLAIFLVLGQYPSWSHRLARTKYILLRSLFVGEDSPLLRVLGLLMASKVLVQVAMHLRANALESGWAAELPKDPALGSGARVISLEKKPIVLPQHPASAFGRCSLCLVQQDSPTSTPCGHVFCWGCVYEWCASKNECPLCRQACFPSELLVLAQG